jgi:hypothetical protein
LARCRGIENPSTQKRTRSLCVPNRLVRQRVSDKLIGRRSARAAPPQMSLIDILGRPLASNEAGEQRIGSDAGVATFGLDALSSAAYGPEAALTVLLPLGAAGLT